MKSKKKILIVTQYFWPENFRINSLALELVKKNHEVTVLTGQPNYPEGFLYPEYVQNPKDFSKLKGVNIVRVPSRPRYSGKLNLALNYFSFVFWASSLGLLRLKSMKFDTIFVFQTSPITVVIPAILLKWVKGCPLTIWVLDLWPEVLLDMKLVRSRPMVNILNYCVGAIFRNCDLVLAQSKSYVHRIRTKYKLKCPVRYFPNWIEDEFKKSHDGIHPILEIYRDNFVVMFAGNLGTHQDFPTIISAAELLKEEKDIMWIFIGSGSMVDWIKAEVISRKLNRTVKLLGRFPNSQMPLFLSGASALLVSLGKGNFYSMTVPGKLQSYMVSGKPILGLLDGEGAVLIKTSESGIVIPSGDYDGLAKAVLTLKKMSKADKKKMGEAGKKYATDNFSKKFLIDSMIKMLPKKII